MGWRFVGRSKLYMGFNRLPQFNRAVLSPTAKKYWRYDYTASYPASMYTKPYIYTAVTQRQLTVLACCSQAYCFFNGVGLLSDE